MSKKILCKEYEPIPGRKRCKYLGPDGLCGRPWRIRCIEWLLRHLDETTLQELMTHEEFWQLDKSIEVRMVRDGLARLNPAKDANLFDPGGVCGGMITRPVSWSQVAEIVKCPRKWWLNYMKQVKELETPHYLIVGSAAHEMLQEAIAGNSDWPSVLDGVDIDNSNENPERLLSRLYGIRGVIRAWLKIHSPLPDPKDVEVELYASHPLLAIRGYVDLCIKGVHGIELKFTATTDVTPGYVAQSTLYMSMLPSLTDYTIHVIRKPSIRSYARTPGQTFQDLEKKAYKAALKAPDKWFAEKRIQRKKISKEILQITAEFVTSMDQVIEARREPWKLEKYPRNFLACSNMGMKCCYYDICNGAKTLDPNKYMIKEA